MLGPLVASELHLSLAMRCVASAHPLTEQALDEMLSATRPLG